METEKEKELQHLFHYRTQGDAGEDRKAKVRRVFEHPENDRGGPHGAHAEGAPLREPCEHAAFHGKHVKTGAALHRGVKRDCWATPKASCTGRSTGCGENDEEAGRI